MRMYTKHNGTLGSRRMRIFINREYGTNYNHKRIRRIMRILGISSVIRRVRHSCTVRSPKEQTAENILNRDFHADTYNQKWLADVTEFKYGNGSKAYLSAILDLGDNRIITWALGHSNNNEKVEMYYLNKFNTYDELEKAISDYIHYYNYGRYQERLNCMTPMEYHEYLRKAA